MQGVFLTVTAQSNPFFEVVHGKQVVFPQTVHGLQHDDLFEIAHNRRGKSLFPLFIVLERPVAHQVLEVFRYQLLLLFLAQTKAHIELAEHRVIQPFPVPLLRVDAFIRIVQHVFFSHLFNNSQYLTLQILTGQESPALRIDDFTLFVNHIIIFQQMFADIEVMALDAALGVFDSLGD